MFRHNEPLSSLTHFVGALLAVAALVLLVVFGVQKGTPWHVVTFSIFGATLILLYVASTVYHLTPKGLKAKRVLRNIDHSMILVLIAGTYTPITLLVLRGPLGWTIFGIVWALTALGIVFRHTPVRMPEFVYFILYLASGWMILLAIKPLAQALSSAGLLWLFLGGVFYTVGAGFYAFSAKKGQTRMFGKHEVFHVFVMLGSFSHFWMLLTQLF